MKKNKLYLIIILTLAIGFTLGYYMSPTVKSPEVSVTQVSESENKAEEIWTCSMHPQIRQNEPGLCPICEMDLIPLGTNSSNDPLVLQMTSEAVKLADIQTYLIEEESHNGSRILNLTGKIHADERQYFNEVSHLPGRIEKLYISYTGEYVSKGSRIAEIYSPELISAQKELLEAKKLEKKNPEILKAAVNKLKYWKITEDQIQEIIGSGITKEQFTIYASRSGTVSNRSISVGDYVKQGEVLFEMIDLSKLWVLFDAYENELGSIKIGDRIDFSTTSLPNRKFKSVVAFIDPMINPITRTASVRAEMRNYNSLLKPEMLVRGILTNNKKSTGTKITIPKTAVMWTGKRSVVYVKLEDTDIPSFEFREVELGDRIGDKYIVLDGLQEGEEIVSYGAFTIDAAAQLNNQSSMMNRKVSVKKDQNLALANYSADASKDFYLSLNSLVESYISLKDDLVNSDSENGLQKAEIFLEKLNSVDMNAVSGEGHIFWMEKLDNLRKHGSRISESKELEKQRKEFGFLSSELIQTLSSFQFKSDALYVQHCPMAFDNTGADWLSTEDKIRNPYFGDKMMKCGLIKKTFE